MKKLRNIFFALIAMLCLCGFASCGKKDKEFKQVDYSEKTTINIGILQYASFGALTDATNGFKDAITAAYADKVKCTVKNPEQDSTLMNQYAAQLVRENDIVLGVATPCATALKAAVINEGRESVPVFFTAVTDPVASEFVKSIEKPGVGCSGTSDANPVDAQISMIKDFDSSIDKVGFFYTISEENSKVQVDAAKKKAKELGLSTEVQTCNNSADISASINALLSKNVDVIYIPTDNNCANNMSIISNVTNEKKIPVICGEEGMVKDGGTFTISINYAKLGKTTAEMVVEMIKGAKIVDMAVRSQTVTSEFSIVYNGSSLSAIEKELSTGFMAKYPTITNVAE